MSALQPLGTMVSTYIRYDTFGFESIKEEFKAGMKRVSAQVRASEARGDVVLSNGEIESAVVVGMSNKLHFYSESMSSIRQNYISGSFTMEHAVDETNEVMAKLTALRQFFSDLTAHAMTPEQRDIADEKVETLQEAGFQKLQDVAMEHGAMIAFIPARGGIVVA